ncbi:MAG: Tar ligand binding domain-containing protein [Burkholderiales bacterium]|nr:Tar ligand binding domain-containing protein [Burkholderiales bacterium]
MRVFTRLALLGGILSALLLVVGGMGLYGLAATNEALRTVYEDRTVPAGQLGEIGAKLISNQLAARRISLSTASRPVSHL